MVWGSQAEAWKEQHDDQAHESFLYPDSTSKVCTLTAGGTNNTFGAWAEIKVDGETFSSKITSDTLITGISIEDTSRSAERYLIEIAYGDAKTVILRHRFIYPEESKVLGIPISIRAAKIPAEETVYYRMMCSIAGETCQVSFRYHYPPQ